MYFFLTVQFWLSSFFVLVLIVFLVGSSCLQRNVGSVYFDRAAGGHRHHCGSDRIVASGCSKGREAARRTQCKNNLKQYGLGLHNYHDVHQMFAPGGGTTWGNGPGIGWQVKVLPFMDQAVLFNSLNLGGNPAFGTPSVYDTILPNTGRQARFKQVPYALCPSNPDAESRSGGWAQSCYTGSLGSQRTPSADGACNQFLNARPATAPSSLLGYDASNGWQDHGNATFPNEISGMFSRWYATFKISQATDGTSNTFLVGEINPTCHDHTDGWWGFNGMGNAHASTSVPPNDGTTCPNSPRVTNPACTAMSNWNYSWGFKSTHVGGVHFLLTDGTVRFVNENIDYNTYQRLGGKSEGLTIGEY